MELFNGKAHEQEEKREEEGDLEDHLKRRMEGFGIFFKGIEEQGEEEEE